MIPRKDYLLVIIQFCLFGVFAFLNFNVSFLENFTAKLCGYLLVSIGLLTIFFAFLQLNTNLSPFPSPKKSAVLVTSGMFNIVRHPIYAGIFGLMLGLSLIFADGFKLLIAILVYLFFLYKSNYEEHLLTKAFPEYEIYKSSVGRFLPKLSQLKS